MKLIIQQNRIAATATDEYTGPDLYITAPEDFDLSRVADYIYDGGALVLPAPPPPTSCTPSQGLVALYALHGITEQQINDAIAAIPDPVERYTAQIGYSRATEWRRDSQTMLALAALLGLGDAQLDALYAYAAGVAL